MFSQAWVIHKVKSRQRLYLSVCPLSVLLLVLVHIGLHSSIFNVRKELKDAEPTVYSINQTSVGDLLFQQSALPNWHLKYFPLHLL